MEPLRHLLPAYKKWRKHYCKIAGQSVEGFSDEGFIDRRKCSVCLIGSFENQSNPPTSLGVVTSSVSKAVKVKQRIVELWN